MDHDEPSAVDDSLLSKVEAIERKVDEILHLLRKNNSKPTNFHYQITSNEISRFKKIRDHTDLIEFEIKLKSDTFTGRMREIFDSKFKNIEKYSKSFRRFGYDVIDTFCSRKLFKHYSWSGKKNTPWSEKSPATIQCCIYQFYF